MKILFTADWHIKLGQKNVPIDWQINRYKMLLNKLNAVDSDLTIVGGDIFDRVPTIDELNLFFQLLLYFNRQTILYSGNHEAVGKTTTFLTKLSDVITYVNDKVRVVDEYEIEEEYNILPYNHLKIFAANPQNYEQTAPILFTHVRGEIPPHVIPEIPLKLFSPWTMVFAGDLHSHSNSQGNIVYPGSPLTINFHRNKVETGYLLIDTKTQSYEWIKLDLPQLIRKTIKDIKDMKSTEFDHTIYEIEGDITDLAKVENNELLDKKIVSTIPESRLALHKDMSTVEELQLFLTEILKLKDNEVKEIIATYNAYIT